MCLMVTHYLKGALRVCHYRKSFHHHVPLSPPHTFSTFDVELYAASITKLATCTRTSEQYNFHVEMNEERNNFVNVKSKLLKRKVTSNSKSIKYLMHSQALSDFDFVFQVKLGSS